MGAVARVRFSIIITCYNQRDFIAAAVESALAQEHPGKEIVVVDDGSSDGSGELLAGYSHSIQLVRFEKNRGTIEARNRGAEKASGEYLVFLDGDDILMPWALDLYEQVAAQRGPKVILGQTIWFKGAIPPVQDPVAPPHIELIEYKNYLAKDRPIGLTASAMVIERQTFWEAGGWSPGIFHLDCWDLCAKLSLAGRTILVCAPHVTLYRVHESNSIHNVTPFLKMAHHLMDKEKAGEYPGGGKHRFQRYAMFGGLNVFWLKRAVKAGSYKHAAKLAASGWLMILAGVVRRSYARIATRHPVETLEWPAPPRSSR
jgi:glycosyltransferase involved in cell wall biosynthesis